LTLDMRGGAARAGITICYEIAYPHLGRSLAQRGADLLVNLSNEAWFPDTAEFEQYTAIGAFRAAEVKRALVRCANSGTSGWIDPWGRPHPLVRDGATNGFAAPVVVEPPISRELTLYARLGEWLGWVCAVAAALGVSRVRRRPRGSVRSGDAGTA